MLLAGDTTGRLTDLKGVPKAAKPREVCVSLLMVPRVDHLKTDDYSAVMLKVSCAGGE
jgi:hypothetical protein